MNIKGRRAVVTGGGRGIGRAVSIALAERGASVAIIYHSNDKAAKETAMEIEKRGSRALLHKADVSVFHQVLDAADAVVREMGGVDILVNNAGITGSHKKTLDISVDEWKKVLDINLSGAFYCCKAFIPYMEKGKIVNISSISGRDGGTLGPHYAASKAGLIGMTFSLAREFAPDIMVNAVAPGPVETDLFSKDELDRMAHLTPFGRVASPEEIAHAVIFLIENDYVSGEVLDVNAGRYMD